MKQVGLVIALVVLALDVRATVSDQFIRQYHDRMDAMFSQLDSQQPELDRLTGKWFDGQRKAALQELADYFRNQAFDLSLLQPAYVPEDLLRRSERALENVFYLHSNWVEVPLTSYGGIDWSYRGKEGDKEVAWMLNRHVILPILGAAYKQTWDTRYRDRINELLVDWITSSPYPDRISFSPQWRPLEAARRVLNSWIHIFFDKSDLLDDQTRLLMLSCLPEHADALYQHASFWGGNHLLTEKTALLALASAWPCFADGPDWRNHAIEEVSRQLLKQSYPDGSYAELSNHYQRVVINNTLPFIKLLRKEVPDHGNTEVYKRIEDMWNYFARSVKPDGWGPMNNASDHENNARFLIRAWELFGRRDWLGIATNGKQGVLPAGQPSVVFPWAGHVFMRSDWGTAAHWVYFDAGPFGSAHQHADRLHLSVTLEGEDLLTDSGRYTYRPGKWKTFFTGPRAHSVILLDGQPSEQGPRKGNEPAAVSFRHLEGATYASATAAFRPQGERLRGSVPWTRHVVLDNRGFVLVFDQLMAFKDYQAEVIWQLAPGIDSQAAAAIITPAGREPESQQTVSGRDTDPVAGYFSPEYGQLIPAVQLSHLYGIDRPTTLCHVISSPGSSPLTVELDSASASAGLQFNVIRDGRVLAEGSLAPMNRPGLVSYEVR